MFFKKQDRTKLEAESDKYFRYMDKNAVDKPVHESRTLSYVVGIAAIVLLALAIVFAFVKYGKSLGGSISDLLSSLTQPTVAASNQQVHKNTVVLQSENPDITVNGVAKRIDANNSVPLIRDSNLMAPIRGIIEALGGEVLYNETDKTINIRVSGRTLVLAVDSKSAAVNGVTKIYGAAPAIVGGLTMVPIRMISDTLNADVTWDENTSTVTMVYDAITE